MKNYLPFFFAITSLLTVTASAANWPQYRGVRASGVDTSMSLPTSWQIETGENVRWQTPIPGLAHSAPIVWGDRIYVTTAVQAGAKSELKVLDKATGRIARGRKWWQSAPGRSDRRTRSSAHQLGPHHTVPVVYGAIPQWASLGAAAETGDSIGQNRRSQGRAMNIKAPVTSAQPFFREGESRAP